MVEPLRHRLAVKDRKALHRPAEARPELSLEDELWRGGYGELRTSAPSLRWLSDFLGRVGYRRNRQQTISTAVAAVLTPICVEKFLQNSDAHANLAALRKISSGSL